MDADSDGEEERYAPLPTRRRQRSSNGAAGRPIPVDLKSGRKPLVRGHTVDAAPEVPKRGSPSSGNPFSRAPLLTSRSLDAGTGWPGSEVGNGMGNLLRASPQDIRQLVQPTSAVAHPDEARSDDSATDDVDPYDDEYVVCRFPNNHHQDDDEEDDLSDLPSRLPPAPPVPAHDPRDVPQRPHALPLGLDHKIPAPQAVGQTALLGDPSRRAPPSPPIREAEYEIMRPQKSTPITQSPECSSAVPLVERELPPRPAPPLPAQPTASSSDDDQPASLVRSRSAHSFSRSSSGSVFPSTAAAASFSASASARERRGTLATTRPSESLGQIQEGRRPLPPPGGAGGRGARSLDRLEHKSRKSRSSDSLRGDSQAGLKEAESLTDVLARTYTSPPGGGVGPLYASPRSQMHQHHPSRPKDPPPRPTTPAAVAAAATAFSHGYQAQPPLLPYRPSPSTSPAPSADYIDMSPNQGPVSGLARGVERRGGALAEAMMAPDGGPQKALDVQRVRRELPEEVSEEECAQVLRSNLWNIAVSVKLLKVRYLSRSLLLDEASCRQALDEAGWDVDTAGQILGEAPESSISL